MNTRKLAGAGAAAISAVTAVAALLLGSTAAVAEEARPDSAFGISASGVLDIPPVPYVESTDGEQVEDQLLGLGDVLGPEEDELAAGVLTVEARRGAAESVVAELNVPELLQADLVRTYCEDGEGGLQIVAGSILGEELPERPVPGETIDASPLLTVRLGEQTRNDDGSLTVTGIEVSVLPAAGEDRDRPLDGEERLALPALGEMFGTELGTDADTVGDVVDELSARGGEMNSSGTLQTITIGSATCADADGADNGDDEDDSDGDEPGTKDVPDAPKPEIVDADLPVTG